MFVHIIWKLGNNHGDIGIHDVTDKCDNVMIVEWSVFTTCWHLYMVVWSCFGHPTMSLSLYSWKDIHRGCEMLNEIGNFTHLVSNSPKMVQVWWTSIFWTILVLHIVCLSFIFIWIWYSTTMGTYYQICYLSNGQANEQTYWSLYILVLVLDNWTSTYIWSCSQN